mmetsp:Transcript_14970/g.41471  ORF Transcript_14970/g.41471 Transcript_14970/m.41471 type:complete len:318 (-) Transcript_14970:153-1106(-)|eukprot:CAMPEP_0198127316 /NCGR_PEP_ID=MMETSP1442-20131203/46882_1 /TAXON_ID= /ORGANISM="Craspedostauros australis, Strain CCMP3328" /LENGTH=317 /DNA_ID=CAMNT_0043787267 /DNA_START=76 /DNA_END=1029 /DNA_ORIENTATION=+
MKFTAIAISLVATMEVLSAFVVQSSTSHCQVRSDRVSQLHMSDDGDSGIPKQSRIEGNSREPTESELTIMDEMVEKLADAKPYELPNAVRRAFRVISSPRFFMRIAELADQAEEGSPRKEKLNALASNLVATLEAVVETTEERLDERAVEVERIVKAAAEPESGEFLVPLLPAQVESMREEVEKMDPSSLDEGFLSTVDAWMNKSYKDGMDGMVGILQKVLQMYSGVQISRARKAQQLEDSDSETNKVLEELLRTDPEHWDMSITTALKKEEVQKTALVTEVQRTMETVVLSLENGSTAQQVQAEFLRELLTRVESK